MTDTQTVIVTRQVLEFAKECFCQQIDDLLDDPSDLTHPQRDAEPQKELARLRNLAADLGLDFDVLITEHGTAYERQRLADIESGKVSARSKS